LNILSTQITLIQSIWIQIEIIKKHRTVWNIRWDWIKWFLTFNIRYFSIFNRNELIITWIIIGIVSWNCFSILREFSRNCTCACKISTSFIYRWSKIKNIRKWNWYTIVLTIDWNIFIINSRIWTYREIISIIRMSKMLKLNIYTIIS